MGTRVASASIREDKPWGIIFEALLKEDRQQRKMVSCAICGKSIPLSRAVKQDGKLICQDCRKKLHIPKRASLVR